MHHAVALAEQAKGIFDHSFQVNLMAISATIQSRTAGAEARAFDQVSLHMRSWSSDLQTVVSALRSSTRNAISNVSRGLSAAHRLVLLERASQLTGGAVLASALANCRAEKTAAERAVDREHGELLTALEQLGRLGMMACVLSRSAKIEAAHTYRSRETLSHVADEFAKHADEVFERVKKVRARIGGSGV